MSDVTDLLHTAGEPMRGSPMGDEDALVYAQEHFPDGNFCLVRDWIWISLEVTDEQRQSLAKTRRQPSLIYAHSVVYDSERRWDVGDFVRTSLLHRFEEDFIFRTLNSAYLLLGPGTRKSTSADTITRIV